MAEIDDDLGVHDQNGRLTDGFTISLDQSIDLLESFNEVFYGLDADWRFIYMNRKAEKVWGRRREALIGKNSLRVQVCNLIKKCIEQ